MKNLFRKQEKGGSRLCVQCGVRPSTKEDNLCDSCRFAQIMDNIIAASKEEEEVALAE